MDGVIIIAAIIGIFFLSQSGSAASILEAIVDANRDAIAKNITAALGLPDVATDILYAQASVETGGFQGNVFQQTNSLFNRHVGNGKVGVPDSDGYWTGEAYYATAADPDVRIYTDVYQSAQDMSQLLSESLYKAALAALQRGDASGYFQAVQAAGFSASPGYASLLRSTFEAQANA